MDRLKYYIFIFLALMLQACESSEPLKSVKSDSALLLGDDRLVGSSLDLIKGKNIALVANRASVLSNGTPLLDTLLRIDSINIGAVFTPEHGYYIDASAGETVKDSSVKTILFYSLYGKYKKPTPIMLENIDLILYDLQDIGSRFYTYISTLFYVIEAAAENNIPVIVLDRPDPVGGGKVEGPVLDPGFKSFVGVSSIPVLYGLTAGELAQCFIGEDLLSARPNLRVIKMKNWKRESLFSDYNLKWINPSPNIPDFETAVIYPSTAFLEGTNISEGRGTAKPFRQIGAPFINSEDLINELNKFQHNGISFKPVSFIPAAITGRAENPKYLNLSCNGILISIEDPAEFRPLDFSIQLLYVLHKLYPEKLKFNSVFFDRLMGENHTRKMITGNKSPEEITNSWKPGLEKFLKIRTKYLLY